MDEVDLTIVESRLDDLMGEVRELRKLTTQLFELGSVQATILRQLQRLQVPASDDEDEQKAEDERFLEAFRDTFELGSMIIRPELRRREYRPAGGVELPET